MSANDLLLHLKKDGFQLRVINDRLAVTPASELSDGDRDAIRMHRDGLVAMLLEPDSRAVCITCRHARGVRCAAHPRSGLPAGYIGGITELLQNCPAWTAHAMTTLTTTKGNP